MHQVNISFEVNQCMTGKRIKIFLLKRTLLRLFSLFNPLALIHMS